MKVSIQDKKALLAVSPAALSAYARTAGWTKVDTYGKHSDVFMGEGLPEIILPRTAHLGDYARVVSMIIEIFAKVADVDELALYRDLAMADRDVVRVRAVDGDDSGSVAVSDGIDLMSGARDMILAAACSLQGPQPLYRAGANREARAYLNRVRLGQTEQGSFAITLLSPVISPPIQQPLFSALEYGDDPTERQVTRRLADPIQQPLFSALEYGNDPIERQVTRRLADSLAATREATEKTVGGDTGAFSEAVARGVSANLCEALVKLIEPFSTLNISLVWARTHPMSTARNVVHFDAHDAPILREAARSFRDREPRPGICLFGVVQRLKRGETDTEGTIALWASIDGQNQAVVAVLKQSDYERAIQAHETKSPLVIEGDLERTGQRWRLLNPRIADVILNKDVPDEDE